MNHQIELLDLFNLISKLCEKFDLDENKFELTVRKAPLTQPQTMIEIVYRIDDRILTNVQVFSEEELQYLRIGITLERTLDKLMYQLRSTLSETGAVT